MSMNKKKTSKKPNFIPEGIKKKKKLSPNLVEESNKDQSKWNGRKTIENEPKYSWCFEEMSLTNLYKKEEKKKTQNYRHYNWNLKEYKES